MASRIPNPIAGLLAINSKLFSPRGGALPKPPNAASYLRFELSLNSFTAVSEARLKLLIIASRPSGSHTSDYRASISFPADGLIDFIYTTPTSALEIPSIFNVPTSANINSFRCLTFAANDFFLNVAKVGVLHSPDVTIDLERLLNTVKNAILLPDAILDVQFLVCGSHGATDAAMLRIHKAMARVVSPAPAPALIEPAESAEPFEESDEGNLSGPNKVLSVDMLSRIYKKKTFTRSEGGANINSSPLIGTPKQAPYDPKLMNWSSPMNGSFSKSESIPQGPNKFLENTPKFDVQDASKCVCFNCYAVGHQQEQCKEPKRHKGGNRNKSGSGSQAFMTGSKKTKTAVRDFGTTITRENSYKTIGNGGSPFIANNAFANHGHHFSKSDSAAFPSNSKNGSTHSGSRSFGSVADKKMSNSDIRGSIEDDSD